MWNTIRKYDPKIKNLSLLLILMPSVKHKRWYFEEYFNCFVHNELSLYGQNSWNILQHCNKIKQIEPIDLDRTTETYYKIFYFVFLQKKESPVRFGTTWGWVNNKNFILRYLLLPWLPCQWFYHRIGLLLHCCCGLKRSPLTPQNTITIDGTPVRGENPGKALLG